MVMHEGEEVGEDVRVGSKVVVVGVAILYEIGTREEKE